MHSTHHHTIHSSESSAEVERYKRWHTQEQWNLSGVLLDLNTIGGKTGNDMVSEKRIELLCENYDLP